MRALGALLALILFGVPRSASAQGAASSVSTEVSSDQVSTGHVSTGHISTERLASAPEGYFREDFGEVQWVAHTSQRERIEELAAALPDYWHELGADLGVDLPPGLSIRVVQRPEDIEALSPGGRAPEEASGVAWPARGVIVLRLQDPVGHEPTDLHTVLKHELSHVALHRATRGAESPRWFKEWLAIEQSGERSLARFETLWEAAAEGSLIPLSRLDAHFPREPRAVSVAYAQAADLVAFLHRQEDGRRLSELVDYLAQTPEATFDDALLVTYGLTPSRLEAEWRADIARRQGAVPSLVGGSTFWVLAILIGAWALFVLRRRGRAKLARWSAEDAARERAADRLEAYIDAQIRERAREELRSEDAELEEGALVSQREGARRRDYASERAADTAMDSPPTRESGDRASTDAGASVGPGASERHGSERHGSEQRGSGSRKRSGDELPEHVARRLVSVPRGVREQGVPTVEHEGEAHTLH